MSICVIIFKCKCKKTIFFLTNSFSHLSYTVGVQEVRKIYQIYIESFFLINLVFLYSIWNITAAVLSCSVTQKRLLMVSVLGAFVVCLFLFLPMVMWSRLVFGSLASMFLGIGFLFPKRKRYSVVVMVICITSVLLGGSLSLLQKWNWMKEASLFKISALSLLFSIGSKFIVEKFFFARQKLLYPVTLIDEDMEIHMTALLDTGNGLIEPISKKPVCLVGKNVFEENRAKEGGRKEFQPQKFRVIPYHSVGKENGILSGYEMDRLIIDTDERKVIIEKPMIGISDVPVSGNDSYQMILQPELLREGVN